MTNRSKKIITWVSFPILILVCIWIAIFPILTTNLSSKQALPQTHHVKKLKLASKDLWGYPCRSLYTTKVKFASGQKYGKTDYVRAAYSADANFHDGWDYGFSEMGLGSDILAIHAGKVHKIDYRPGMGWYIWVISPDGYVEIYQECFNFRYEILVKPGQQVKVGQKIGVLTGSHLHLGVTKVTKDYIEDGHPCKNYDHDNGTWLNPMKLIQASLKKQGFPDLQQQVH